MGPEGKNALQDSLKLSKIGRFLKIGIRPQAVCLNDVLVQCGARKNKDGNDGAVGILTKPLEDVQPVHAGHLEVHQNDIGGLTAGIGERGFSFEVRNEFAAITRDVEAPNISAFGEG